MKNIYTNTITLIASVMLLLYLISNQYFTPYSAGETANWYNITIVLIVLWVTVYSFTFLLSYLTKKKLAYGKNEFPPARRSQIESALLATLLIVSILLHLFHILTFTWGVSLSVLLLVGMRVLL